MSGSFLQWPRGLAACVFLICSQTAGWGLASAADYSDEKNTPRMVERIVVVGDPAHSLSRLLQAELTADGWTVVLLDSHRLTNAELKQHYGAIAVLRADAEERTVGVWVAPDGRRVIAGRGEADSVVAIRAVEVLRAHLLSPKQQRASPPAEEIVPEPVSAPVPTPIRVLFQLAPAVAFSPGGLGARPDLAFAVEFQHFENISSALGATVPLSSSTVSGPEGTAELRPYVVHASIVLSQRFAAWRIGMGAGVAVSHLRMLGEPATPEFEVDSVAITNVGPQTRLFAGYSVAPKVSIRSELLLGVNLGATVVQFDGRRAARWGQPFGALSLGVGLAF